MFWFQLTLKLVVVYAAMGFFYWEEVRFASLGQRLEGQVLDVSEVSGKTPSLRVRYQYRDPERGVLRSNVTFVSAALCPPGKTVAIDFIPGENCQSRMAVEARPSARWIFLGMNAVIGTTIIATLGYFGWEANHVPLTRQQRAVEALRRERSGRERHPFFAWLFAGRG